MNSEGRSRRPWIIIGSIALGIAVVAVAGIFWFFSGDAPEEVSLEGAVEDVQTAATEPTDSDGNSDGGESTDTTEAPGDSGDAGNSGDTGDAGSAGGIEGTWVVDTSIGEFSFEDATSSFVGFRIKEELSTIGETEAVGRTPTVDATLVIEGTTLTSAEVVADMTDIVTETSRRDDRVQGALSTSSFPTATFTLTEPIDIGDLQDGDQFSVTAVGDLLITDIANPIEIPLEGQVVGDVVVVVGSVDITFADWGISVPSAPVVLSVEDHGPLELQLFFVRS